MKTVPARTSSAVTIKDSGIDMSENELVISFWQITMSGTKALMEAMTAEGDIVSKSKAIAEISAFNAHTQQLKSLVINTVVFPNREIFLRELISSSSNAFMEFSVSSTSCPSGTMWSSAASSV